MKKVFISRRIPEAGILLLKNHFDIDVWDEALPPTYEQLVERARNCDAVVSLLSDKIDRDFFDRCPKVKVIANFAVGYNNIDIIEAKARGVLIGNTPDVLTEATADLAFSLTLACSRKLISASRNAADGQWKTWEPLGFLGQNLRKKTVGIMGIGRIGFEYAKLMKNAFQANIIYTSRSKKEEAENVLGAVRVDINRLASESDVLSIHCPLSDETANLIDIEFFNKMKSSSIIINTARGEIVDQDALYQSLFTGKIFAAGLDVTTPEPLSPENELFNLENCIILPHIGSATLEARTSMSLICAKNIIAGLEGNPLPYEV